MPPLHRLADDAEQPAGLRIGRLLEQRVGAHLDRGERIAQVVRHHREHVVAREQGGFRRGARRLLGGEQAHAIGHVAQHGGEHAGGAEVHFGDRSFNAFVGGFRLWSRKPTRAARRR